MDEKLIEAQGLTIDEYRMAVEKLGREPNILELGMIGVMWSEHCSYKSSKIHLKKFPTRACWVIQGPGENAGIIEIDDKHALVFKIESHNHPSYIEPFQGAATGVGGILRDIFTMGARPVALLNSLRFGKPHKEKNRYIINGVVSGISWYGNCIGVPTVGGETFFAECYDTNPLVNVMCVGIVEKDKIFRARAVGVGNPVIYVGSKTGRDGIHGATMASEEFDEGVEEKKPNVQVGDPFTGKLLLEACLEAMEKGLILGIQDMGAAGLTCACSEMATRGGTGMKVYVDRVPQRENNMTPYEIMLSESQERMLIVAEKGNESRIMDIFKKWGLDAVVIGEVTDDGLLKVISGDSIVAELPARLLTEDAPIYNRAFEKPSYIDEVNKLKEEEVPLPRDLKEVAIRLLSSPNIASKRFIWRRYDHMVQTNLLILPGSDCAVLRVKGSKKGVALSTDCNPRFCYLNPREGGKQAVAEAARNVALSGAIPRAITNCLNFGSPERPDVMWQFVECIEGMAEACRVLETPVTGGNVSFYNETMSRSVWPTPTVGMVGIVDDVEKVIDQYFKDSGDIIVLIGEPKGEVGGSEYLEFIHSIIKGPIPEVDLHLEKKVINAIVELVNRRLIKSAHDVSLGGLLIALFESSITPRGFIGWDVEIDPVIREDLLLFGEDQPLVIISFRVDSLKEVGRILEKYGLPYSIIGVVRKSDKCRLKIGGTSLVFDETEIIESYSSLDRMFGL
ncbi:MAG: phosphoribosylformylglycinamidine synthase subunit PurL [Thermosulfidibacteraceae bacterium]